MADSDWQGKTNPRTGQPYQSQDEYDDYQAYVKGQQAAASDSYTASMNAGPGYNFNSPGQGGSGWDNTRAYYQDTSNGDIYFGGRTTNNDMSLYGKSPSDYDWASEWKIGASTDLGYIDPSTGMIYYTTKAATYDPRGAAANPGAMTDPYNSEATYDPDAQRNSRQYSDSQDYGLGKGNLGIIPIAHDAQGSPTAFYVPTAGGGGTVLTSLSDAQTAIANYRTWKQETDPNNQASTTNNGSTTPTGQTQGELLNPGTGENWFDSTKGFYTQPTNEQDLYNKFDFNQPTNEQQQWNAYSGQFGNPQALNDVYTRAEQQAQTTLDRKAASAGWGDSGAAARATGNLGIQYQDAATKAMENWALTGSQMAGAADSANLARQTLGANLASGADSSTLARMTAGQNAANASENLDISRLTGGLNAATTLGEAESSLMYSGLTAADQQQFQTQMTALALKVQQGQLSATAAYSQAQDLMSSMGAIGNAALRYYVTQQLGQNGKPASWDNQASGWDSGNSPFVSLSN